ncbi:MAG: hypothetical protein K1000chlam4_00750 [Chlamydiae bacterium]|nr:hypothetical protein [Chlamydiota bacterium]
MIQNLGRNDKFLDRAGMAGAILTISLIVAGAVALLITQSGVFHPYCSPLIGIGLWTATIPTIFVLHCIRDARLELERKKSSVNPKLKCHLLCASHSWLSGLDGANATLNLPLR